MRKLLTICCAAAVLLLGSTEGYAYDAWDLETLESTGSCPNCDLQDADLYLTNLQGADLRGAELQDADLQEAKLQKADLRGANLRGADLDVANLQGANLQDANLQDANLRNAHLEKADLRGANLREANLWGAYLRGANLQGADLRDANLRDADLRRAKLDRANLIGADLRGAKLDSDGLAIARASGAIGLDPAGSEVANKVIGSDVAKAVPEKPKPAKRVAQTAVESPSNLTANLETLKRTNACRNCYLQGADLRGADLQGANLQGADLYGANLQDANLRGADLWEVFLRGADLRGADLQDANLEKTDLRGANLQGAGLYGADLQDANLEKTDLRGANLQGAGLYGANLRYANLEKTDLRGANLQGADLYGANLQDANLRGADLWEVFLRGADLRGAKLDSGDLAMAKRAGAVGLEETEAEVTGTTPTQSSPPPSQPSPKQVETPNNLTANLETLKRTNACRNCYLLGADLPYADLQGADLQRADLWGANLRRADLRKADLGGAELRGADLGEADLRGANLQNANLLVAKLRYADLYGANLRGAKLDSDGLAIARASGAIGLDPAGSEVANKVIGSDVAKAVPEKPKPAKRVAQTAVESPSNLTANLETLKRTNACRNCYLQGADLYGAALQGADLYGADLQGADLHGAALQGANLRGADLRGAFFWGANLQGADLRGAKLDSDDLAMAKRAGAVGLEETEEARLAAVHSEQERKAKQAEARAAVKREKARYDALVSTANADLAILQDFVTANPGTVGLVEIVTDVAAVKAALAERKESAVKTALTSLRATLAKEKGFSAFMATKKKERQKKLAAEKRRAEEKRKREVAEAKRRKEERRSRQAAQVKSTKADLKSYAAFLKRQVAKHIVSNSALAQALVIVVKSLDEGHSSTDLSVLESLKGKAAAAVKKHGLAGQYAEVQKLMAVAHAAKREKAAAAERKVKEAALAEKERKEREARLPAEKKAAAVLAAKQAEEREALQKRDRALAARQEKYREAIAVVIGNRKYANRVPAVEFAHNDARAMRKYLMESGYREGNIIFIKDATQSQMMAVFGTKESHRGKLFSYVRPDESDVTVFYSGHGVPGLKDRRGYLLPVNADPNLVELNGYPIDLLYSNLNKVRAKTVRVYMDACFSGDSPKGMLVRATSGISITPRMPEKRASSTMISITAAQGDQFASWDEDAKHGLFTKHLLIALRGAADKGHYGNGDGKVTVGEVKTYLDREMTYQARRRYNRDQVATVSGDSNLVLSGYR